MGSSHRLADLDPRSPELEWLLRALRNGPSAQPLGPLDEALAALVLETAKIHGVAETLLDKIRHRGLWEGLPEDFRQALYRGAKQAAARELFLQEEIARDLLALASRGIQTLLLKGTALAYTIYPAPEQRPRADVDLLFRDKTSAAQAWGLLRDLGYERGASISGALVSHQFSCARRVTPRAGLVLDVHWKLNNANFFAQRFAFEELYAERLPVPALGPYAFTLSLTHALVLALFHRLWHLGEGTMERLIWLYDIDLICRRLTPGQWEGFVALVTGRELGPICRDGLKRCEQLLETPVPAGVLERLDTAQPSAHRWLALKQPGWRRGLAEFQSLPSWSLRLQLLREHLLPDREYMEQRFQATTRPALALAYLRRFCRGLGRHAR